MAGGEFQNRDTCVLGLGGNLHMTHLRGFCCPADRKSNRQYITVVSAPGIGERVPDDRFSKSGATRPPSSSAGRSRVLPEGGSERADGSRPAACAGLETLGQKRVPWTGGPAGSVLPQPVMKRASSRPVVRGLEKPWGGLAGHILSGQDQKPRRFLVDLGPLACVGKLSAKAS